MGSEIADPVGDRVKVSTSKKSPGKIPRKINKAAREKLKRDHINDLFVDLGKTLDLNHPNNGKASMIRETIRLVGELLSQVESLKKENVTLLSESNYVTTEKDELQDENSALDAQIKRLQREIDDRSNCSHLDVSQPPQSICTRKLTEDHAAFPLVGHAPDATPVVGPVFVMPLSHEPQGFPASPFPEVSLPKVPSSVSRPRARYPSSTDSWPSQILTKEANMIQDV